MKPLKLCKTCIKNERFSGRTICLSCINKAEREKMRERAKRQREKQVVKKQKARQKKAISISVLKKEADAAFSIFIRDRDSHTCITCGKRGTRADIDAGHYIPRDCLELRYDPRNVNAQCKGCNVFKKGNYTVYALKMIERYGANILYELDETVKKYKADGTRQYKSDFYLNIIEKYKN